VRNIDIKYLLSMLDAQAADIERMKAELEQYKADEANGLLIRLPCKVGDTVYVSDGLALECQITGYAEGVCVPLTFQAVVLLTDQEIEFEASEIGETVFFDFEAALDALKG
jgi:hypothetical protein